MKEDTPNKLDKDKIEEIETIPLWLNRIWKEFKYISKNKVLLWFLQKVKICNWSFLQPGERN